MDRIKHYSAVVLSMFFWSFTFIWVKQVFEVYSPIATIFLRLVFATGLLFIIGMLSRKLQPIKRKEFASFILLTLFEPFLYFLGESHGLELVSSTVGAVLISTIPLFTPVVAYLFLKERITLLNVIGIVVSIGGVLMVIMNQNFEITYSLKGVAYMMVAVIAAVVYSVLIVKQSKRYNIFSIIFYQCAFGMVYFLPVALYTGDVTKIIDIGYNAMAAEGVVKLSLCGTILAFLLYSYALKNLGTYKANSFINLIPVFTAVMAYIMLDEMFSGVKIIGIVVVVAGLFISQIKSDNLKKRMSLNAVKNKLRNIG